MSKDAFIRQTLDRSEDMIDASLAAAGRVMGRAIGFFRRLGPGKGTKEVQDKRSERVKVTPIKKRALPGPSARPASPPAPPHQVLEDQVTTLELELDQVYSTIIYGARPDDPHASASAAELEQAVQRARELRTLIQEQRQVLGRQQRELAREQRLHQHGATRRQERAAPRPVQESSPDSEGLSRRGKRRSPMAEVIKRAAPKTGAQRLAFEKTAQGLLDPDPDVRRVSASRLGELGYPAVLPVLVAVLDDPAEKVRLAALNAVVQQTDIPAPEVFKRFIHHPNPHLRLAALRGLSKLEGEPEVTERLIEALEDDEAALRKAAAMMLGWRGAPGAITALTSALHDEEAAVRRAAATSLGALRNDHAVFSLINTVRDPDRTVREAAALALQTITGEPLQVNSRLEGQALDDQVNTLHEWWRASRIAIRLRQRGGDDQGLVEIPALPHTEGLGADAAAPSAAGSRGPRARPAGGAEAPARTNGSSRLVDARVEPRRPAAGRVEPSAATTAATAGRPVAAGGGNGASPVSMGRPVAPAAERTGRTAEPRAAAVPEATPSRTAAPASEAGSARQATSPPGEDALEPEVEDLTVTEEQAALGLEKVEEDVGEEEPSALLDDLAPELQGLMASPNDEDEVEEGNEAEEGSLLDSESLLDAPGLLLGEDSEESGGALDGLEAALSPSEEEGAEDSAGLSGEYESVLGGEPDEEDKESADKGSSEEEEFESVL